MKTILKPLILLMLLFIVAISEAKSNLRVERDYGVGVSTSIKNNAIALLKVYPNPANDILYFDKSITKATATIYSSEGRMMLQKNLNNNQIPIQNLPNGLYHLHLQVGEQSFHAAFVKQ
jgi:hypothetical protein